MNSHSQFPPLPSISLLQRHRAAGRPDCSRPHTAAMSRRRVSVKELGQADCQGWLLRRKEGRRLLGSNWKRYWFVLKRSCLYWYSDKMAAKAEGFINLCGFTIEAARQSRKKHALTASHPLVVSIFIAAESFTDMNRWISKMSQAAEQSELISAAECYSEDSDQDGEDSQEQETADCETGDAPPPCSTPPNPDSRRRSTSEVGGLSRDRRRRRGGRGGGGGASEGGERLSCPDLSGPPDGGAGAASAPLLLVGGEPQEEEASPGEHLLLSRTPAAHTPPASPPDELERLCGLLTAASLSPIGQSSRRDLRASFVRRCHDDKMNEKLHLLRILSSTLKAKESELLAVDQILSDPALAAPTYRKWRASNAVLLQEIAEQQQAAGGAAPARHDLTAPT